MLKAIVPLLLLLALAFTQTVRLQRTSDVPLINYQMIPSQRWKVSAKELVKLKEKLKIFVAAEIQKEGSILLRKYYKEFYPSDEQADEAESGESPPEKETEDAPPSEKADMGDQDEASDSFDVNGPVQLI
ncbi:conserved Plasmodium protein, unknown function [Plasmodium vivax]|uniref:Uncharacterized protein n=6 Tax=Plasmodium vivax TaxID=5855 RepID=A5K392_PLAVS|nr:hypothetical protein PVX_117140 [Plasmodium vivax]KMZ78688.1 hypothetical protein PVIIG_00083 [Plasmodium vivax India VII]KMZ85078.1 hypothetical protein PVBG_01477 [Plasmodium vivax Brazil I]KMZ91537.1 hypothetical protein PVMG_00410 [Plasmodium vivax Mauritania I]KMZ98054.1 hypothetical protein PVNG_00392 [Plasmodium vivax North Korean]EDL45996.1 hypothetical protein PVX_117140 [Plasmodium vivax]|eukprot:XP_001615723.1 hypothetical protein [Plasmodium vivax Sal-1]